MRIGDHGFLVTPGGNQYLGQLVEFVWSEIPQAEGKGWQYLTMLPRYELSLYSVDSEDGHV